MPPSRRAHCLALAVLLSAGCGAAPTPTRSPEPATPPTPVTPAPAPAPAPVVDAPPAKAPAVLAAVDVFGSAKVPAADVLAEAGLELGGPADLKDEAFHARLDEAEARVRARFGFAFIKMSAINYFAGPDAGKTYVTIDLVDAGDEARLRFAAAPTGTPEDPAGLIAAWTEYEDAAWKLLRAGTLKTGTCRGGFHCALGFGHPDLASREDRFIAEAPRHMAALRTVLTDDGDENHRGAAAYLLAYGADRAEVVAALVPAIRDSSGLVRNNAMRVLVMLQEGAPTEMLPLDPLLAAMRFPLTTDRNKATYAVLNLIKRNPDRYRAQVLTEVGDLLVQMVTMSQPNNRDPAISILEALSGQKLGTDAAAWRTWVDGQRPPVTKGKKGKKAPKARPAKAATQPR